MRLHSLLSNKAARTRPFSCVSVSDEVRCACRVDIQPSHRQSSPKSLTHSSKRMSHGLILPHIVVASFTLLASSDRSPPSSVCLCTLHCAPQHCNHSPRSAVIRVRSSTPSRPGRPKWTQIWRLRCSSPPGPTQTLSMRRVLPGRQAARASTGTRLVACDVSHRSSNARPFAHVREQVLGSTRARASAWLKLRRVEHMCMHTSNSRVHNRIHHRPLSLSLSLSLADPQTRIPAQARTPAHARTRARTPPPPPHTHTHSAS